MNLSDTNFTEDDSDLFYDWVESLMISKDIWWRFQESLDESKFSDEFEYSRHDDSEHSATVRSYHIKTINLSSEYGHDPASCEVWALKVANGWLITDPITFSLG